MKIGVSQNVGNGVFKKVASGVRGFWRKSSSVDTFERLIKEGVENGKKVEGTEKFLKIINRIVKGKPIKEKEAKQMLKDFNVMERLSLGDMINKLNAKLSDLSVCLSVKSPKDSSAIMKRTEGIMNNGSEVILNLLK